jgi:hypothetical protein
MLSLSSGRVAHAGRPALISIGDTASVDARGYGISGATVPALSAYEAALSSSLAWRSGAEEQLALAMRHAPAFVMAHALQAYLLVCSRDVRRVQSARPVLAAAERLPANERERMHLAAIAAVLDDDYELARVRLGALLTLFPRDVLALQVAHAFDHVIGDTAGMRRRVELVIPAWPGDMPGYHAVLSMHAFSLAECAQHEQAEEAACAALDLCPTDARAHHAMAHVFEMTARPEAGMRWMARHAGCWSVGTTAARHCWWHVALFSLAREQITHALMLYDRRIRPDDSAEIAHLIDASALLWRIQIHGGEPGPRWDELAAAWHSHIEDGFCSFNDMHAMLAFVGAGNSALQQRLEAALLQRQAEQSRHGVTTRQLGLAACQGLSAFGRGDYVRAVALLASLPALAHRLGGSHAQRDVLYLTLQHAVQRLRRGGMPASAMTTPGFADRDRPVPDEA